MFEILVEFPPIPNTMLHSMNKGRRAHLKLSAAQYNVQSGYIRSSSTRKDVQIDRVLNNHVIQLPNRQVKDDPKINFTLESITFCFTCRC